MIDLYDLCAQVASQKPQAANVVISGGPQGQTVSMDLMTIYALQPNSWVVRPPPTNKEVMNVRGIQWDMRPATAAATAAGVKLRFTLTVTDRNGQSGTQTVQM